MGLDLQGLVSIEKMETEFFFLKFKQLFERQGSSKTQKVSSKFKYPVCLKQPKGKTIPAKNQEKLQNYFKNCYRRNTMKCLTVYQ